MHEHELEALFKKLRSLQAPEHSILRAKNIVMATVRRDAASRLEVAERSSSIPFIHRLIPQYKFKHMPILAIILAVVLGGGGTVAAAQNDLPGDALYGVKLASERVAENFTGGGEARINFEVRLAERRAAEIATLKAKARAEAEAQAQAAPTEPAPAVAIEGERAAHVERAVEHLERRVERMQERVEKLKAKDTEGTLRAAAVIEAKLEVWEDLLDAVEEATTKAELKAAVRDAHEQLEETREHAEEVAEEAHKRHASEVGIEASARGRVNAAENKLAELTRMRERILERAHESGRFLQAEFDARDKFYQEAVRLVLEAKAALEASKWEEAWENANEAFKMMVQLQGPVFEHRLMKRIAPEDVKIHVVPSDKPMTPEEAAQLKLTPERIQQLREDAAAGAEAKRLELLKALQERRRESAVPAPAPVVPETPDTSGFKSEDRKEINVGPYGYPVSSGALSTDSAVASEGIREDVTAHAGVSSDLPAEIEAITKIESTLSQ